MTRLRTRLRREDGFTLVEMLVAALMGTAIMLAALGTVGAMARRSTKTADRVEALQDGRRAIADTVRTLRSASCPDWASSPEWAGSSLLYATATRLFFWADLDSDTLDNPRVWELDAEATANGRRLVLRRYSADLTRVDSTRQLAARVNVPASGIFTYSPDAGDGGRRFATPLSATELNQVARIDVDLDTRPDNLRAGATPVGLRASLIAPAAEEPGGDGGTFAC